MAPREAVHTRLLKHNTGMSLISLESRSLWGSQLCVLLTGLTGGWSRARDVPKDGAGLRWTWRNCSGRGLDGPVVSTASHTAALDGDGLGHVHAQQGAERLRLRGTHAGHHSGLDPKSAGN